MPEVCKARPACTGRKGHHYIIDFEGWGVCQYCGDQRQFRRYYSPRNDIVGDQETYLERVSKHKKRKKAMGV